jgi:hypothetical protein
MVKVFLFNLQNLVKFLFGLKILFSDYKKIFWIKKLIFGSKNLSLDQKTYLWIKKLIFGLKNLYFGLKILFLD